MCNLRCWFCFEPVFNLKCCQDSNPKLIPMAPHTDCGTHTDLSIAGLLLDQFFLC